MLQFVPIENSLEDDAPGHSAKVSHEERGPTCWKCKGTGTKNASICGVCSGKTYLGVKSKFSRSRLVQGTVAKQTVAPGWLPSGPQSVHVDTDEGNLPLHLRLNDGEQLCTFVGNWKIFQRTGGHRWTTDDIVTAWVAGAAKRRNPHEHAINRALDLGCGNGSVLMMVAWQYPDARCVGIEARSEAVALARRSIEFNCGIAGSERVTVCHADFRVISRSDCTTMGGECTGDLRSFGIPWDGKFDLITGTPPYFRVDFELRAAETAPPTAPSPEPPAPLQCRETEGNHTQEQEHNGEEKQVVGAYIRQGGMPTCKESAPARCEFRGGIEAYCDAAAVKLAENGRFVVCENWLNHDRVLTSATAAGLQITSMQRVIGREGKPPLFCVYTMVLAPSRQGQLSNLPDSEHIAVFEEDLVVRDRNGAWTPKYADLLRDMSYPVASLHPNGTY